MLRAVLRSGYHQSEVVIAPFFPSPLIEKLKSEGFRFDVHHQFNGAWAVNLWLDAWSFHHSGDGARPDHDLSQTCKSAI